MLCGKFATISIGNERYMIIPNEVTLEDGTITNNIAVYLINPNVNTECNNVEDCDKEIIICIDLDKEIAFNAVHKVNNLIYNECKIVKVQADIAYPAYHHPKPFPSTADSRSTHNTMKMIVSSIHIWNQIFERIDFEFIDRFPKLDKKSDERFGTIDRNLAGMIKGIDEIMETQKNHKGILNAEEQQHRKISYRLRMIENYTQRIEIETNNLREDFLKLQSHSMKYNLILEEPHIQIKINEHENT
ncbi:unnamed protein product [Mytilus coruscus]|uniref:Uncharacterized protein n=1 Tax=Mytilus coruscus TaxID=42192 RepID=A0A6J8CP32_MYTCO|nr:unnamed protein product [Mytilus coruscus]